MGAHSTSSLETGNEVTKTSLPYHHHRCEVDLTPTTVSLTNEASIITVVQCMSSSSSTCEK